jgi:hypothetical protein
MSTNRDMGDPLGVDVEPLPPPSINYFKSSLRSNTKFLEGTVTIHPKCFT